MTTFEGETVIVETRAQVGTDERNAPIYGEPVDLLVHDVLVSPGATDDVAESNRIDGRLVKYTLYFPRTFKTSLDGLHVRVKNPLRDEWEQLRVIGAPRPHRVPEFISKWNMKVGLEEVND